MIGIWRTEINRTSETLVKTTGIITTITTIIVTII
jgi:hypothetical protein